MNLPLLTTDRGRECRNPSSSSPLLIDSEVANLCLNNNHNNHNCLNPKFLLLLKGNESLCVSVSVSAIAIAIRGRRFKEVAIP